MVCFGLGLHSCSHLKRECIFMERKPTFLDEYCKQKWNFTKYGEFYLLTNVFLVISHKIYTLSSILKCFVRCKLHIDLHESLIIN